MCRRKKKTNKLIPVIISFIAILIVFLSSIYLFKNYKIKIPKKIYQNQKEEKIIKNYIYIGKQITNLSGKVKYNPILGYFYYELIDNSGSIWGLKSNKYDLSLYEGKEVILNGETVNFFKDIPILKIKDIKYLNQNLLDHSAKTGNNFTKIFYYPKYGLIFNFGNQTGYIIQLSGGNQITILYQSGFYQNNLNQSGIKIKKLLTIQPFLCNPKSNINNCNFLNKQFKSLNFEYFISSNGLIFYNIPESHQWFTSNDDIRGYYVTPYISKQNFYKVADYIYPYDINKLKNQISHIAIQLCNSGNYSLYDVKDISLFVSGNNLFATLKGEDQNGNEIECLTFLDFKINFPALKLIKISSNYLNTGNVEEEPIINISKDSIVTSFEHGFNISVNYKNIVYKQGFKKTNLGIENLDCGYFIKIKNRKQEKYLDTDPDVVIRQCKSILSKQELKKLLGQNTIIKEKGKYFYIIKYKSNRRNIAENIGIKPF